MSRPIIEVDGISKRYRLGEYSATTLRDELAGLAGRFRRESGKSKCQERESVDLWALREVSFCVNPGEIVGIIGRNGAGKSTLLKILSRVTEATVGEIRLRGRIASLLEVGAGFHPDLTGRENIFLNGAVLGMSRAEVARKFDEIVEFAEIGRFLDTPVKRYSSGMYVRLAFAVAAHLEPEILIVDEVLAVGDAGFQSKCLGKINEVATNAGRTVVFVSHNLAAIQSLCTRCLFIQSGRVLADDSPAPAIQRYLESVFVANPGNGDGPLGRVVRQVRVLNDRGSHVTHVSVGAALSFEITLASDIRIVRPRLSLNILSNSGDRLCCFASDVQTSGLAAFSGERTITIQTDSMLLAPGRYPLEVVLWDDLKEVDALPGFDFLNVESSDIYGTGRVHEGAHLGLLVPPARWSVE